jgi:putative MATE family efflux protein
MLDSNAATGAVGVVFSMMAVIQAIGFFFGQGSGNYISRCLGEKRYDEASSMAATGFFSALAAGTLICIVGQIFLDPLAYLLGSTDTILPYTRDYLRVILLGAPWMTSSLVLNNQLRFQGGAVYAMVGISSGAVLNIILDPILIFTFDMGVAGAGLATIISQFVSFCLLLLGCSKGGNIRIHIRNVKVKWFYYKMIFRGGLPSLARQSLASLATICLNHSAGIYGGDAAIAAMGVVQRVMMFGASTMLGFGQGFQPVCGFNYGAKKYGRVRKGFMFTLRVMFVCMLIFAVIGFAFPRQIVSIFNSDATVIEFGTVTMRFQCMVFPLMSLVFNANMAMQTMGMAARSTILSMARQGVCFIPMILILPPIIGAPGIQIAQACADAFAFAITVPMVLPVLKMLKQKDAEQAA